MKAYQRLLSYVKISTPSNEESSSSPSSQCQFDLARLLVEELKGLGISDVSLDEHCYVYAHLPATEGLEHCKALGFIAHMDTVSDFCDHAVTPVVTEDYDDKKRPAWDLDYMMEIGFSKVFALKDISDISRTSMERELNKLTPQFLVGGEK